MRRVASFLLAAGLVLGVAPRAHAAPTSSDPKTAARNAAAWLASQVNDDGFVPSPTDPAKPNLSVTVQAVPALASAGVGKDTVNVMLAYLGKHIDDYVVVAGEEFPAAIANLILAAKAGGQDPAAFGSPPENLIARLKATRRSNGLYGTADPTFDGVFRQGLTLLALAAVGQSDAGAVTWLEDQQCANGLWTAFRADTTQPCPAPDPVNFTGPDTNSTAAAMLGLTAQDDDQPAAKGADELDNVRTSTGGWSFIAVTTQAIDSSSTGLVLEALRTLEGKPDAKGLAALLALQVGCTADPVDRGGIAFQAGAGGALVPDAYSTAQAVAALAEVALPVINPAIATTLPTPCVTTTTSTVPVTAQASTTTTASPTTVAGAANELPRTGSSTGPLALVALLVVATGFTLTRSARRRR